MVGPIVQTTLKKQGSLTPNAPLNTQGLKTYASTRKPQNFEWPSPNTTGRSSPAASGRRGTLSERAAKMATSKSTKRQSATPSSRRSGQDDKKRFKRIPPGFILPSAAYTINRRHARFYEFSDKKPEVGDLLYGRVTRIGQHSQLENKSGRIHKINDGSRGLFVFGNRYAPDYYEGFVPDEMKTEVDLIARSGVVGRLATKNSSVKDPTRVRLLGYVCDENGDVVNTRNHTLIKPTQSAKKPLRSKLILVVGTSMNSGKSTSAVACCWALTAMGYDVRASKITGTASLKDILYMQDAGAKIVNDFTHFGYPSTYMLDEQDLLKIFDQLDLKYANNPKNFWVVEIADGLLQRETALLLRSDAVRDRIHRLIFAAHDAFSAVGGIDVLKNRFDLVPDALSGVCSGSPLAMRELSEFTDIPVFNNLEWDLNQLSELLL
jgi:hypothetical protein